MVSKSSTSDPASEDFLQWGVEYPDGTVLFRENDGQSGTAPTYLPGIDSGGHVPDISTNEGRGRALDNWSSHLRSLNIRPDSVAAPKFVRRIKTVTTMYSSPRTAE